MFSKRSSKHGSSVRSRAGVRTYTITLRRVCEISGTGPASWTVEFQSGPELSVANQSMKPMKRIEPKRRMPWPWVPVGSIALRIRNQWQKERGAVRNKNFYRGYPKLVQSGQKNDMTRSAPQRQPTA